MDDAGNKDLELSAKMESAFNKLGITLMDSNGQMKSTFQILSELAEKYPELDQNTKNYYASLIGGKTQVDVVNSVLSNFNTAIKANEAAMNSAGSATKENEVYLNSLQGKLKQLESAWQEFSVNTINSTVIKIILDLGTKIVKLADTDIARLIAQLAVAKIGIDLFTKALETEKVISFGKSLKAGIVTVLDTVITAFKAGASNGTVLNGVLSVLATGFKGLGSVIAANPIFAVITAFTILKTVIDKVQEAHEKELEVAQELADNYSKQVEEGESLLKTYNDLSEKTNLTTDETKNLSDAITKLSKDYGVSTDSLMKEGEERDSAIKKIQDEIDKRKQLAATAAQSAVDWKSVPLEENERDVFTERNGVQIGGVKALHSGTAAKLSQEYDLEANSVADLQKKLQGYIVDLENTTDKTKEQKKELELLSSWYKDVTDSMDRAKKGYSQALENMKEGLPITEEQQNVLYNLGEITEQDISILRGYYKYLENNTDATEENKDMVWEAASAGLSFNEVQQKIAEQEKENTGSVEDLSTKIDEEQTAYKTLAEAVDEYNNSGYLSIDTLQSLLALDDEHLSMLSMQDGQLALNTTSMDNLTSALVAERLAQLQSAAAADLNNLAMGNTEQMSNVAKAAIDANGDAATALGNKYVEAVPKIAQFTQALLNAKSVAAGKAGENVSANFETDAQKIIASYEDIAKKVTSLGATTTGQGGYGSQRTHRYTGSNRSGRGSSRSSGSGVSKSTKDEYKATIDTLYSYKNALDNAKESVDKLKDSLGDTDNYDEQEKYIRQLIDALNNQINKTNDLKKAQSNQINDYINQLRAQGFAIDYNAEKNELYINNMQHLADFSGDTAKNLESLIKKIQDLNSDNRNLDGSVRNLTGDIKDYYEQLADIPEEKLKKFNDLMDKFQQSRLDQVQAQVDDLKHEMENDPRLKALEDQIDALENQNDELDKQKELDEKILAVEQAKEKLANANRQRNIQLYTEDQGWIWTADVDSIKEAAEDLKDAQDDLNDKIKQDQIDQLKAEKEALEKSYQDRIDALENFLDEQNYQIDKANREGIKSFEELQNEMAKYGINSAEYLSKATDWLNNYNQALQRVQSTVQNITSPQAQNNIIYSSAVQDRLAQALSSTIPVAVQTGLQLSQVNYNKPTDNNKGDIYIENIQLPNVRDVDDFVEALKDLPRIATTISAGRK